VAVRTGLPAEGPWVATLAAVDSRARTGLTVLGPQYPLARYSVQQIVLRLQDTGAEGHPTTLVFAPRNDGDMDSDVCLWLWWNGRVMGPSISAVMSAQSAVLTSTR